MEITLEEKVKKYEEYLHQMQLYSMVTMDHKRVEKLITNACQWSHAHRAGNGEYSDEEQQEKIEKEFLKLTDI